MQAKAVVNLQRSLGTKQMAGLEINLTCSTKITRSISAMSQPHNRPGGRAGLTFDFTKNFITLSIYLFVYFYP